MKNLNNVKVKLTKIAKIVERIAFVATGLVAGYASTLNLNHADYKTLLAILAVLCLVFGLVPMFVSYAKAVWGK